MNYYSGVLCVAIGTLLSIYAGRAAIKTSLATNKLPKDITAQIDKVMIGHKGSLQALISQSDSNMKQAIIHTAQQSVVHSFSIVMLMCMVAAILGAIGIFFIVKKKRTDSGQP